MTGYTNLWHYSHNDFGGYVGNGMTSLVSVDLSYSDFSNVTTLDSCFEDASALASVNFEGIRLGAVTTTESMFEDCASLPGVDVSPIPFGSVTKTESMFQGCKGLQSGRLAGVDTRDYGSVTTMNSMFRDSGIVTADFFQGMKLDKVVTFESVFRGCDKLVECDLSGIDFSSLVSISQLFYGCGALPETGVDVSGITVTDVFKKLSYAFYGCAAMKNFGFLGELDTAGCTDWSYAFSYCTGLDKLLDLGMKRRQRHIWRMRVMWMMQGIQRIWIMWDIYAVGRAANIRSGMSGCWHVPRRNTATAVPAGLPDIWILQMWAAGIRRTARRKAIMGSRTAAGRNIPIPQMVGVTGMISTGIITVPDMRPCTAVTATGMSMCM